MSKKILILAVYLPLLLILRLPTLPMASAKDSPSSQATSKPHIDADPDEDDDDDSNGVDDDEEKGKAIAGNVSLATDYVYRGVTQTNNQPALQGGFDWKHPIGLSLGVYGSNVYFPGSPSSLELATYGAYTYDLRKDWNVSAGLAYLSYFQGDDRNTLVIPVRTQWREYSLEVDYSPNFKGEGDAWYFLVGWSKKLIYQMTFGAYVGYSIFSDTATAPNYVDSKLTVAHDFLDLEWMLSGILVKHQDIGNSEAVSRIILSVTKAF